MTASYPLAALAGLLSFLSPCVFPLVPSYLAYVGGNAGASQRNRVLYSLLFIVGFSAAFVALGASATWIGAMLRAWRYELIIVGGIVIIVFGLGMLGVLRLPFLMREARMQVGARSGTPHGAVLLGFAFAIGWSPCIGPILATVLTLASTSDTVGQGMLLLAVYALGLGVPFLLAALAFDRFLNVSRSLRRHLLLVERIGGSIMVIMGVLMVTGYYTAFNGLLQRITPDWLISRL